MAGTSRCMEYHLFWHKYYSPFWHPQVYALSELDSSLSCSHLSCGLDMIDEVMLQRMIVM